MPDTWTQHRQPTIEDIEQLRGEIRTLRDEQARQAHQLNEATEERPKTDSGGGAEERPKNGASAQGNGDSGKPGEKGSQESPKEDDDHKKEEPASKAEPHPVRNALIVAAAVVVAAMALLWWLHARRFEDTDDAQVDGHISGIAARVAGTVTGVYVEENQFVKAGEVVADLDPHDQQVALEQARSQLRQALAQTQAEQPNVPVTQVTSQTNISTTQSDVTGAQAGVAAAQSDYESALAKVREAQANSAKAQADVARYQPLAAKDEVPREQYDAVSATAKALLATVAANQAAAAAALKQVDEKKAALEGAQRRAEEAQKNAPKQVAIREANISARRSSADAARAQVDQALLNLSYCKVITPVSGIVAKRTAEVGQYVTPGQQVLLVAQTDDLWVTANFRETQLRRMRPGQGVRIHVDALAADFDGYVDTMPAATGAVTSLLPPENATGNFVKVVQRLPVRIRFKPGQQGLNRLRPGMSVEPKVRVA